MSITTFDIKKSSFTQNLDEVDELTLNNRGLVDLGSIGDAPNLCVANLSFNKIESIQGLAGLKLLHTLNISHNQIKSLKGLSSLPSLTQLNVSYNKLSSLNQLSGLAGLRDVWLQHNMLQEPNALKPLSCLTALQRLCVTPNPLCGKLPGNWRVVMLRLCKGLQVLDAAPLTEDEHTSCSSLGPDEVALNIFSVAAAPASRPSSISTIIGSLLSGPMFNDVDGSGLPRGGAGRRGGLPPRAKSNPRQTNSNTLPSVPGNYKSLSQKSILDGGTVRARSESPGAGGRRPLAPLSATCSARVDADDLGSIAGSDCDAESVLSFATSRSSVASGSSTSRGYRAGILRPRPRANANFLPPIKAIPEGSSFLAVLAKLPNLDAKLPPTYTATQAALGVTKKPPAKAPADAQVVDYERRYPRHAQNRAVTVKRDGSVVSYWPNGDLAVTVDVDYAGGAGIGGGPLYRMFAMYRQTSNVAASFENGVSGGFVQYPNGNVAMIVNADGGTTYAPTGESRLKWSYRPRNAEREADPAPCSSSSSSIGAAQAEDEGLVVDLYLDSTLGMRFLTAQRQLQLYICCEGLRYVYSCGANLPAATWGDPGGDGSDDAAVGGAGAHGATVSGQDLPAPAFLQQLIRESSAAAMSSTTRVKLSAEEASGPPTGTQKGFASIADSLKALDDSLTSWASDRVAERAKQAAEEGAEDG